MPASVIAAQMYTLRDFTATAAHAARTLRKVRDIGYEAVQISGFGPMPPADVAKMLKDTGLTCCSTHMGWPDFLNETAKVIEINALWGCKHPALGGLPKELRSAEGVMQFAPLANQVGQKLVQAGMDFSYHNHEFEFARSGRKTWLDLLLENTDPRYLKAELDTHWVQTGGGDVVQWVNKVAGRMPVFHLKDYVIAPDKARRFAEIGEGNLNWPPILAAARKAGVEWYCVEQDLCYERNPFDSLKISLENLRALGLH
jgi:sugar phosphate isomerase/epimerase